MKVTSMKYLAKSLMTMGILTTTLGYVSLSYGQESSTNPAAAAALNKYLNVSVGYAIESSLVLAAPGGTTGANIAVGDGALTSNTTGVEDAAVGVTSLSSNTEGSLNTGIGWDALKWNTTGGNNTALGWQALVNNALASHNTAAGVSALHNNDLDQAGLANYNTAVGWDALFYNQDGASNTAIGYQSCLNVIEGSDVTCIGANAGPSGDVTGPATYIANVYSQATTGSNNPLVCVSSDGRLGTTGCASSGTASAQRAEIARSAEVKLQDQARRIAELERRLSQLESLIGKKSD